MTLMEIATIVGIVLGLGSPIVYGLIRMKGDVDAMRIQIAAEKASHEATATSLRQEMGTLMTAIWRHKDTPHLRKETIAGIDAVVAGMPFMREQIEEIKADVKELRTDVSAIKRNGMTH